MSDLKDTRWTLRVTESTDQVVRAAALTADRSLADFVVGAAVGEAEHVLAGRTRFALGEPAWSAFVDLLDRPVREPDGLRDLMATDSVFD